MRKSKQQNGLRVRAIAGTYVVTLGMTMDPADLNGFLGFSIHRADHSENEAYYLKAMKVFEATDPGFPPGKLHSTRNQLIQSFYWADYSAKPGHKYTYTIEAKRGTPENLETFATVVMEVETEDPLHGDHDIYFNRGIAASQEYVRRFGDRAPDKVPNGKAYEWLSRGLYEAMITYMTSCEPGRHALRIAAYEFYYEPVLHIVRELLQRGVDVKFVYDARQDSPRIKNEETLERMGLNDPLIAIQRTDPRSYISHNKFIVKLDQGRPVSVWTGGTNFSEGGIFGHSNVAHVVEDEEVADRFHDYWLALADNPLSTPLKKAVERISPLPAGKPPQGTTVVFSPRTNLDALDWYARLAKDAQEGLFMTFAFGMNDVFKEVYEEGSAKLRFAVLDKIIRGMKAGPKKDAELARMLRIRRMNENVLAVGSFIKTNKIDGWVKERLTGLNFHVKYIHNKFMLIDPLTDDPIVIAGSANFSDSSTRRNDENMVVVRGNTRVADIYFGEFLRLYSHHAFREWAETNQEPKFLRTDDWWRGYFRNNSRSLRRQMFSGVWD